MISFLLDRDIAMPTILLRCPLSLKIPMKFSHEKRSISMQPADIGLVEVNALVWFLSPGLCIFINLASSVSGWALIGSPNFIVLF